MIGGKSRELKSDECPESVRLVCWSARCASGQWRDGAGERGSFEQPLVQSIQVGKLRTPIELGAAQIQIAQGTAHSDVSQGEVDAHTERLGVVGAFFGLGAEAVVHERQGAHHLVVLAGDPVFAAMLGVADGIFYMHCRCGLGHAIGNGFPALGGRAVAAGLRQQAADRRQSVQVLDDDAGVEQAAAVVHDEAGHFAQRVVLRHLGGV